MLRLLTAALVSIAFPAALLAQDPPPKNTVEVSEPFARATPPSAKVGVVFMSLNSINADAVLIGGSTDAADEVQLHNHLMEDGIVRMRRLEGGIELPKEETVTLEPSGLHLMLIGLTAPLKRGEAISVKLEFENAEPVEIEVPVLGVAAKHGEHGGHGGHGDHGHAPRKKKHDEHGHAPKKKHYHHVDKTEPKPSTKHTH